MLDEQHGYLMLGNDAHHGVHQRGFLFGANAAGWLVEQQHLRITNQRHGNIDEFAHPLRHRSDQSVTPLRYAELDENGVGTGNA
ncbi:hypothetical protein D3C78_1475910 [compost metagenome]